MSYLDALDALVDSRPHLEPGNYATMAAYRADQRGNMQARNDYRAIRACVAPDDATLAELARGSRLSFETADDGTIVADYCAGQYYPVEYRRAAVRLIASAWWRTQVHATPLVQLGNTQLHSRIANMNTKQRLLSRRSKSRAGKSTFAYPPCHIGARMDDGMQWIEDGCIRERKRLWSDEVNTRMLHSGWYCDQYSDFPGEGGTYRGCVIMLSHGRFIAGYRDTSGEDCGTRIDVTQTFDDEFDAAQYADECARIAAEHEREWRENERAAFEREERESELALAHAESDFCD